MKMADFEQEMYNCSLLKGGEPGLDNEPVFLTLRFMLPFKISVLVFIRNAAGELLLLQRLKKPNQGLWSPIGGKLEMALGESPFEAAVRETEEETGLKIATEDLHLFCMISEKGYEASGHWLMFLFDCSKVMKQLPADMDEGHFAFVAEEDIAKLDIPETDRELLWKIYFENRTGFTALRADCHGGKPEAVVVEQQL